MVKKIFLTVAVVICCGAVLVAGAWCSAQVDSSPCTEVHVVVKDSLERQFVTADGGIFETLSRLPSRQINAAN